MRRSAVGSAGFVVIAHKLWVSGAASSAPEVRGVVEIARFVTHDRPEGLIGRVDAAVGAGAARFAVEEVRGAVGLHVRHGDPAHGRRGRREAAEAAAQVGGGEHDRPVGCADDHGAAGYRLAADGRVGRDRQKHGFGNRSLAAGGQAERGDESFGFNRILYLDDKFSVYRLVSDEKTFEPRLFKRFVLAAKPKFRFRPNMELRN